MVKMLSGRHLFRSTHFHRLLAVGVSLLLTVLLTGTAWGQQVSGTVTSVTGGPLRGVSVRVQGTELRTLTDANGKFSLTAPPDALLNFSLIGRRAVQGTVLIDHMP